MACSSTHTATQHHVQYLTQDDPRTLSAYVLPIMWETKFHTHITKTLSYACLYCEWNLFSHISEFRTVIIFAFFTVGKPNSKETLWYFYVHTVHIYCLLIIKLIINNKFNFYIFVRFSDIYTWLTAPMFDLQKHCNMFRLPSVAILSVKFSKTYSVFRWLVGL